MSVISKIAVSLGVISIVCGIILAAAGALLSPMLMIIGGVMISIPCFACLLVVAGLVVACIWSEDEE